MSFVAHELRTPLTPVMMLLQSLERKAKTGSPVDLDTVARARRQTTRLARMIGDAVDLSKLCENHLAVDRGAFDLTDLLAEVVEAARPILQRHRVQLEVAGPLLLEGDRSRLERVFANLIEQQERVAPHGGTIRIRGAAIDGMAVLSFGVIADQTPRPQPPVVLELVPWDGSLARLRGPNLGLYLAQTIISLHGGRLTIEPSDDGSGELVATLPLHADGSG